MGALRSDAAAPTLLPAAPTLLQWCAGTTTNAQVAQQIELFNLYRCYSFDYVCSFHNDPGLSR